MKVAFGGYVLKFIVLTVVVSSAIACRSQMLLKPQDIPTISKTLETFHGPNSLKCSVLHDKPKLDFSFRWIVTYSIDCSSSKLGPEERLVAYFRLQPRDGQPIYFVDPNVNVNVLSLPQGNVPVVSESLNHMNPRAVAVGEGDYAVDFLLGSTKGRMFREQWSFKTAFHKNPQLAGLPPNSAEVFSSKKWNEQLTSDGPKLTILLHATALYQTPTDYPIVKSYNLTANEQSYWFSSLNALLTHIPHKSADVTAFSIEHEEEIFRQQNFDEEGYRRLSEALSKQTTGKIVVPGALQAETLSKFLVALVKQDKAEKDTGRIVIFLGPTAWLSRLEIPKDLKKNFQDANTRLFYLQYYDPSFYDHDNPNNYYQVSGTDSSFSSAAQYPKDGIWKGDKTSDSIDNLVKALGGQILRVHSAEEFRQSIAEVLERVKLSSK